MANRTAAASCPTSARAMAVAASRAAAARSASSAAMSETSGDVVRSRAATRATACGTRRASRPVRIGPSSVAIGELLLGSAPTATSIATRMPSAVGRVTPSSGSLRISQSAGRRTRWSARALLAPNTASTRAAYSGPAVMASSNAGASSAASRTRANAASARVRVSHARDVRQHDVERAEVLVSARRSSVAPAAAASTNPHRESRPGVVSIRPLPTGSP